MQLSTEQLELLKQIRDLPQGKRVTRRTTPPGCKEFEAAGYVKIVSVNPSDLLTEITPAGRQALDAWESRIDASNDE
jgi:hypothetical protein